MCYDGLGICFGAHQMVSLSLLPGAPVKGLKRSWVAVKELELITIAKQPYYLLYLPIMLT